MQQMMMVKVWNEHKAKEREALEENNTDKEQAKIDNTLHTVSFDLQAVLRTPHAGDAQIYYKRKLSVYNFTVYENHTANGHCFVWDETEGGRGSGCSLAVFTIELIHHGWDTIPVEVPSIVARLQLRTTWLDMVYNLGFWR
ncbi:hypothetical protein LOTGIDRAFT_175845 [Lottia gigantea]|uniref:Uncharacterized protein n=1 Tax=Lottia gigantea TaxID=225164 RepID=V4A4U8_LOTGI|nr:hypothetical protein LOTGIDRAFT_175845 [Lottia gigantea]ESO90015.1 hypothetical protein LOTGIDRAFT_175845 [Lottia gigantea]